MNSTNDIKKLQNFDNLSLKDDDIFNNFFDLVTKTENEFQLEMAKKDIEISKLRKNIVDINKELANEKLKNTLNDNNTKRYNQDKSLNNTKIQANLIENISNNQKSINKDDNQNSLNVSDSLKEKEEKSFLKNNNSPPYNKKYKLNANSIKVYQNILSSNNNTNNYNNEVFKEDKNDSPSKSKLNSKLDDNKSDIIKQNGIHKYAYPYKYNKINLPENIKHFPTINQQSIYSALNLNNVFYAMGLKDGTIEIRQFPSNKIITFSKKHGLTVKSLSLIKSIYSKIPIDSSQTINTDLITNEDNNIIFASASCDTVIGIWSFNIIKYKLSIKHLLKGHLHNVSSILNLNSYNLIVSGGVDYKIKLWDIQKGNYLGDLGRHNATINSLILINKNRFNIDADFIKNQYNSNKEYRSKNNSDEIDNLLYATQINNDLENMDGVKYEFNYIIISVGYDKKIKFYGINIDNELELPVLKYTIEVRENIKEDQSLYSSIELNNNLTAIGGSRDILVYDFYTMKKAYTISHYNNSALSLNIICYPYIICGHDNNSASIYNIEDKELVYTLQTESKTNYCTLSFNYKYNEEYAEYKINKSYYFLTGGSNTCNLSIWKC